MRRTAWRNRRHLISAAKHLQPARASAPGDSETQRHVLIQNQMLKDQGLPITPSNRFLLGHATIWPIRLYSALLYAEVEFFEKQRLRPPCISEDEVRGAFNGHRALIDRIKALRNRMLHPSPGPPEAELSLLRGPVLSEIAELQIRVDCLIEIARERIRHKIDVVLNSLPARQEVVCQLVHFGEALEHPVLMQYPDVMQQLEIDEARLSQRIAEIGGLEWSTPPSEAIRQNAANLGQWLTCTVPHATALFVPQTDTVQPALDEKLLPLAIVGDGSKSPTPLIGNAASEMEGNNGYLEWLIGAFVLLSEVRTSGHRFRLRSDDSVGQSFEVFRVDWMANIPRTEGVRLTSLSRCSTCCLSH